MAYHVFSFSTGWCETSSNGKIFFKSEEGFDTPEEGIWELGRTLFNCLKTHKRDINIEFHSRIQDIKNWSKCCLETRKNFSNEICCRKCGKYVRFVDEWVHPTEVEKLISLLTTTTLEETSFIFSYLFNSYWDIVYELSNAGPLGDPAPSFELVNVTNFEWFPNYKKHRLGQSQIEILEITIKKINEEILTVKDFGESPEDFNCISPSDSSK